MRKSLFLSLSVLGIIFLVALFSVNVQNVQSADDVKLFINGVQVYPSLAPIPIPIPTPTPIPTPIPPTPGPGNGSRIDPYKLNGLSVQGFHSRPGGIDFSLSGGRKVYFEVDPFGYTGTSYDFFTMWITGFTNSEFLDFYCLVVNKASGAELVPEKKLDVYRSLQHPVMERTQKGIVRLPYDLDNVRYIYAVENEGDKTATMGIFWTAGKWLK